MAVALPAPIDWSPPTVPSGMPVVDVANATEFLAAIERIRRGEVICVDVRPQAQVWFPNDEGKPSTLRSLQPDPGKRPIITCLRTSDHTKLPSIVDTNFDNYAGVIQGLSYFTLDGFQMHGSTWGFGVGYIGGLSALLGKLGVTGLRGRRWVLSSQSEATLMIGGRGVYDVELEDIYITHSGREGIYIGDGSASTADTMGLIDGLTIRRFEVTDWGRGTDGAEAVDWKQGRNVHLSDGWCHHGRTFSQAAITAPGPNLHLVLPNKPSGSLRRIAIGHIELQAGRTAIDGSGIYLSAGDVDVEDLTVFDLEGWAVIRGRNAPLAAGTVTVKRVQYASCRSGLYNPDAGPNSQGYEAGSYPSLVLTETTERTDLGGAPSSWDLDDFGERPDGGVTEQPPPGGWTDSRFRQPRSHVIPLPVGAGTTKSVTPDTIDAALASAVPGDVIVMEDGDYATAAPLVVLDVNGTAAEPITLAARNVGGARLHDSGRGYSWLFARSSHIDVLGVAAVGGSAHTLIIGWSDRDGGEIELMGACRALRFINCTYDNRLGSGAAVLIASGAAEQLPETPGASQCYAASACTNGIEFLDCTVPGSGGAAYQLGYEASASHRSGAVFNVRVAGGEITATAGPAVDNRAGFGITVEDTAIHDIEVAGWNGAIVVHYLPDHPEEITGDWHVQTTRRNRIWRITAANPDADSGAGSARTANGVWLGTPKVIADSNLIWDVGAYGIYTDDLNAISASATRKPQIRHNTIVRCGYGPIGLHAGGTFGLSDLQHLVTNNLLDAAIVGATVDDVLSGNVTDAVTADFTGPTSGDADAGWGAGSGFRPPLGWGRSRTVTCPAAALDIVGNLRYLGATQSEPGAWEVDGVPGTEPDPPAEPPDDPPGEPEPPTTEPPAEPPSPPGDGEEGFDWAIAQVRVQGTVASFTDLEPDSVYYVRVRAEDASGNAGPWSLPKRVRTARAMTVDLVDEAITEVKLAVEAVTESRIATGAVVAGKIADAAVEESKLADGAVTTDKLHDNAITQAKVATGAITSSELADAAVIAEKIAAQAVATEALADAAVTDDKIASIDAAKITTGYLSADRIQAGTISLGKLVVGSFDNLIFDPALLAPAEAIIARAAIRLEPGLDADVGRSAVRIRRGSVGEAAIVPDGDGGRMLVGHAHQGYVELDRLVDLTGDVTLLAEVRMDTAWGASVLLGDRSGSSGEAALRWFTTGPNLLWWDVSLGAVQFTSTVDWTAFCELGEWFWVAAERINTRPLDGRYEVRFWHSTTGRPGSWTMVDATVGAAPTVVAPAINKVRVGYDGTYTQPKGAVRIGRAYQGLWLSDGDARLVVNFDPSRQVAVSV